MPPAYGTFKKGFLYDMKNNKTGYKTYKRTHPPVPQEKFCLWLINENKHMTVLKVMCL